MIRLVGQRLAIGVMTLFAVSVLVFTATEILPGDLAQAMLGEGATPETIAALRQQLGLDRSAVERYVAWLARLAAFDLGVTQGADGVPVGALIADRLSNTLALSAIVASISIPLAVTVGLLAAMFPASVYDRVVTFLTMCLIAVPDFFIATLLILLFTVYLGWFPSIVMVSSFDSLGQMLYLLALPILTLCKVMFGQIARMTRAAVLNVLSSPYIEMAILKGVPRRTVILRHALRNVIGPIANVIAVSTAYLISGVVIVETIFGFPGIAKLMVDAVQVRDIPLVQACGIIVCGTYVLLILLADLVAIASNPRLRHPR